MPIITGNGLSTKDMNKIFDQMLALDSLVTKYQKKFNNDDNLMIDQLLTNNIKYEEWIDFYTCFNSCMNDDLISAIADAEVVTSTIKKKVSVLLKKQELRDRLDSRKKDKHSKTKR